MGSEISKMWKNFAPGYRSRDTAHAQWLYVCGSDMRSTVQETLSRSKGQRSRSQGHAT